MFFVMRFLYLTERLNNVRSKLKNVIRSFEMTLNSKHRTEKIKTQKQRNENMKSQNTEKRIPPEKLENVDLNKPVLNKIKTTHE